MTGKSRSPFSFLTGKGMLIFIFLLSVYTLTGPGHLTTSMDTSAGIVAESIVKDGDLSFTKEEIKTHEIREGRDGKYYCIESLGILILPVPFIILSLLLGIESGLLVLLTNHFMTALSAVIIFLIGGELKYSRKTSLILSLIYGLGTMAWVHSRFIMPDPMASLVFLTTFLFLLKYKRSRERKQLCWTGIFAGLALHTRPDAFVFIFAVSVGVILLLWENRKQEAYGVSRTLTDAMVFLVPVVLAVCLWGYYNYYRFGSVLVTGYKMASAKEMLEGSRHLGVFHYLKRFLDIRKTVLGFLGMWIIPNRSIFFINPILIFVLFTLKPFYRKYRFELIVIGIAFFLYVFLYSNRGPGGFPGSAAWGQRYFLPMIGFMVLTMGLFVKKVLTPEGQKLRRLFIALFLLSFCFQFIGASQDYRLFQMDLEKEFGPEKARVLLTMDPRHGYVYRTFDFLRKAPPDFMYYRYLTLGDNWEQPSENRADAPRWVWPTLLGLLTLVGVSGYLLWGQVLKPAEAQPKESSKGKKRKGKRR